MIKEAYCSEEVSILLKEKGFEGDISAYYHIWDNGNKVCSVQEFNHSEAPHLYIPAPTHQMAMKWLREEKHYDISIILDSWALGSHTGYYIVIQHLDSDFEEHSPCEQVFFDSYEEAVETALKYCLENLI